MEKYSIRIASEFSDKPGGRGRHLGSNSGQEFYEDILLPRFEQAISDDDKLYVYLDGAKSYPNSFLDQSFYTQMDQLMQERFLCNIKSEEQRNMIRNYDIENKNPIICLFHLK